MLFIFITFAIFIISPKINGTPLHRTNWPQNRTSRYDWGVPSQSLMGKFKKAAVTCDHGICSEIGRDILIKGGNAIDSSIASLFCLGVTNPQSSGLGGGFIMTLFNQTTQKCLVIDARETAPGKATQDMFHNDSAGSKYGWRAIATPGELAGYWKAYSQYGSGKIAWKDIVMPSVELARNGVPISEYLANVLKVKEHQFLVTPSMKEWINPETGAVWEHGDIIKRTKLANTLEEIANSDDPVELFYHGKFAKIMAKEFEENGATISGEDLANYNLKVYETPLSSGRFNGDLVMCGPPPPASFAVAQAIIALGTKKYCDHTKAWNPYDALYNNPQYYHDMIEFQKFAYAQRTLLGDGDYVPAALELAKNMTKKSWISKTFKKLKATAQPSAYYGGIATKAHPEDHGTSHVSVLDEYGNGVAATTTINRWFGASVQSSLGVIWNDEMDDFSTPGMENGFGFAPSETNYIVPGKRPMSSMSPLIIYHEETGKIKMVMGASGGSKIISAVSRPIVRVLCFNETIKEAIDAPSLHNQFTPDITQFEADIPPLYNNPQYYHDMIEPSEFVVYWKAYSQYGSGKISWKDIVMPSVELARNGVPISEYLANVLKVKEHQFLVTPSMKEWINPETGAVWEHRVIIKRTKLANTLEEIANNDYPVELFYHGKFAKILAKEFEENGATISGEDLANYNLKVYETPLSSGRFNGDLVMCGPPQKLWLKNSKKVVGATISGEDLANYNLKVYETPLSSGRFNGDLVMCGPPPPASFAVAQAIIALGTKKYCDHTKAWNPYDAFAYAQRTLLGDGDYVPAALELAKNMTKKSWISKTFKKLKATAQPSTYYGGIATKAHPEDYGTSHVSVLDEYGNGVAATTTINRWFGASVQSSLGVIWNDEMDDFSTPGMENGFGFAPSVTHYIVPGKRPMSSMSPLIIYHEETGKIKMVIFNETIKESIDAPSLHNQFTPDITQFEADIPPQLIKDLETKFGQKFKPTTGFEGIVQAIHVDDNDGFIYANGDYRQKTNMHPEGY